jgi:hypothetical protein
MARPKAKIVPVRLEIKYERCADPGLNQAITVLAAMLRKSKEGGGKKQVDGENNLPHSIVSTEEYIR